LSDRNYSEPLTKHNNQASRKEFDLSFGNADVTQMPFALSAVVAAVSAAILVADGVDGGNF
jgi:hypothetical protein